jgi:hypothetical protein
LNAPVRAELLWVSILLVAGFAVAFGTVKAYRARGHHPVFYQQNFGPAVMMACGFGFTQPPYAPSPPSLREFLLLQRDDFSCADFPSPMPTEAVTWNGTWYYLYGTTALVWRIAGISWLALDWLSGLFGAMTLAGLYGLFRLVTPRVVSALVATFVMLAPAHLEQIPMLRDYSKAPFVLAAVLTLAWLVARPLNTRATILLAAAFGAIVGVGYGFRSDLLVMAPFGVVVALVFLPGDLRTHWQRNLAAAAAVAVAFVIFGLPPLRGQQTGGCQFHYGLLGLTTPLVGAMGIEQPIYRFGDHLSDTFVDLKVGDHSNRVVGLGVPNLCAPDYDAASADLFFRMVRAFPADFVVHAYGSVQTILRAGMTLPRLEPRVGGLPILPWFARQVDRAASAIGRLGPVWTAIAVAIAWAASARLGVAMTVFVLFLAGYPAIQFDGRHWFHLRFIPVWSICLIVSALIASRARFSRRSMVVGVAGAASVLVMLVGALGVLRLVQRGSAAALLESYLSARTESIPFEIDNDPSSVRVDWQPLDYGLEPGHRSSDMLVVLISPDGCGSPGSLDVRVRYLAPLRSHDVGNVVNVHRGAPGGAPTQLFVPVFSQGHLEQSYLRFTGVETPGRPADCIRGVARFADRAVVPLWIQAQIPPGWQSLPLYQRLAFRPLVY